MEAIEKPRYVSVEEYLAAEEAAPYKNEYYAGEVVAMAGASDAHNVIVANIIRLLGNALYDRDCTVRASDQRVHLADSELYVYPDATVVCGPPEFQEKPRPGVLLNPAVVVEVLSASTEGHDRSDKLLFYLRIPALRHYVLVDSQRPRIEVYSRPDATTAQWVYQSLEGQAATALLDTLGVALPLSEVYRRVEFQPPLPPPLV
ncbi:Uma2 family endonuclease [Hymenobacter gummosus]|uniref:Uma2 family endonuclease n=1 Tax=Hymenobacter gummosus TaxID=1776032 RepID=A0A3S0IR68_9BACT|nr:Uma2 family endonuclease [Hymenobacter gummosus]RTQ52488.1 Uma2 family endonuclease [Hymenobacter gummosus]